MKEKNISTSRLLNEYVAEAPFYYKNINLRNIYLNDTLFRVIFHQNEDKEPREFVRRAVSYLMRWRNRDSLLREERSFDSFHGGIKYLFVCGFAKSNHVFSILADLIEAIEDKDCVLVVTDQRDVYEYYSGRGLKVIYLKASRFYFDPEIVRKENGPHTAFMMSRAELFIDYADKLYDEFSPKVVMTTQDCWAFDQCFVHAARNKGIMTITHMHGVINDSGFSIFEHVFADKIMLWGENHRRRFARFYSDDRLIVMGTSKFDHLLSCSGPGERIYITLAINTLIKKTNINIISKVINALKVLPDAIKEKYTFMLKLHPALNSREWERLMKVIARKHCFDMTWEVRSSGNKEIFYQSKLLIVVGLSTAALEAMICGVSVIELILNEKHGRGLFKDIPDLLIPVDRLAQEVKDRIEDEEYNAGILERHKKYVRDEISSFHCVKKELEVIDALIKEREQEGNNAQGILH
ncbi:MAG: hypothetical protein AB1650_06760 [Candidatus Omnitrophota bacterium]